MFTKKQPWMSKTVWAAVGLIAHSVFGFDTGGEDVVNLAEMFAENANQVVEGLLGILALVGRLTAKKEIGKPEVGIIE